MREYANSKDFWFINYGRFYHFLQLFKQNSHRSPQFWSENLDIPNGILWVYTDDSKMNDRVDCGILTEDSGADNF